MAIISGIGVRNYYEKRGYDLENHYMVKRLPSTMDVHILICKTKCTKIVMCYHYFYLVH